MSYMDFTVFHEKFVRIILNRLKETDDENLHENYLKILLSIITNSNESINSIAYDIIEVSCHAFKISSCNQKNRENALQIISTLMNKLSFLDGRNTEQISAILDKNNVMQELIALIFCMTP